MDVVDVKICLLLLQDSRRPYRDIADQLELSINAVHRRIQKLVETKVIRGFTTNLSLSFLGVINVIIFGHSTTKQPISIRDALKDDEYSYWLSIAGGNELYIGGHLHNPQVLDDYVRHVQGIAEIPDPTIGLIGYDSGQKIVSESDKSLDRTDYRIIAAMQNDSRVPLSEVADKIGLSAKTVRRRIESMEERGILDYSIRWYPESSNDIISVFNIHLLPGTDRNEIGTALIRKHYPNSLFFWAFSNIPNHLMLMTWNSTMSDMMGLQTAIREQPSIENLVANIVYSGYVFETWRNRLIQKQLEKTKQT